ncbi:hypothetical protein PSHT_08745, partial [Puccinia striiformis]
MKLAMLTNQTNSSPDRNPKMGNYHYLSYRQSCPEVVVHEDGNFDRHPSRLKRVRVHEEERRSEERGRDKQLEMDSRWSNLQPGRGQAIDRSRINHQPEEMEEEEEDGEGESLGRSYSSQHSSPPQPTTPDQTQHPHYSWSSGSSGSSGWSTQTVTNEIELLSVIEKQAETYSSGPGSDTISTSVLLTPAYHHQPGSWPNYQQPSALQPPELKLPLLSISEPSPPSQHSKAQQPSPTTAPAPVQDKPFKCSLCTKSFTRNYDLTRHKSSHIDQRQHRCTKCGRSFNRRD